MYFIANWKMYGTLHSVQSLKNVIKLKNKQSKKLFPIKVLEGEIKIDDEIKQNNKIFGKVLIDENYPFGLIKFKDQDIKIGENFSCGTAKIKILKPNWFD